MAFRQAASKWRAASPSWWSRSPNSAIWLGIALLFSTWFRSTATAALAALALWLVFTIFWPMLSPIVANILAPVDLLNPMTALTQYNLQHDLMQISPATLYAEMLTGILHPSTWELELLFRSQLQGALVGSPLSLGQSLLIVWPDFSGLVAGIVVVFTLAYVSFQRQEGRA
ncbi:ABC transporter permease subunit [Breoghania sp.]|uniref:ABC transporter permease subunit n=1 Tax=Breoghania sp. TaxID=2065378 RepID=UPI0026283647|nr:ABC transporter permease subunit [Breoghania sp.]MDJ0931946.1 ABC transporter permease subunit [Breoghania sp.]